MPAIQLKAQEKKAFAPDALLGQGILASYLSTDAPRTFLGRLDPRQELSLILALRPKLLETNREFLYVCLLAFFSARLRSEEVSFRTFIAALSTAPKDYPRGAPPMNADASQPEQRKQIRLFVRALFRSRLCVKSKEFAALKNYGRFLYRLPRPIFARLARSDINPYAHRTLAHLSPTYLSDSAWPQYFRPQPPRLDMALRGSACLPELMAILANAHVRTSGRSLRSMRASLPLVILGNSTDIERFAFLARFARFFPLVPKDQARKRVIAMSGGYRPLRVVNKILWLALDKALHPSRKVRLFSARLPHPHCYGHRRTTLATHVARMTINVQESRVTATLGFCYDCAYTLANRLRFDAQTMRNILNNLGISSGSPAHYPTMEAIDGPYKIFI